MPTSDEKFLAMGVREGWLTPATIPHTDPMQEDGQAPHEEETVSFGQLMQDLARDREDR